MAKAGWYTDPSGQAGMLRYWTGQAWSTTVMPVSALNNPGAAIGPGGAQSPASGAPTHRSAPGNAGTGYDPSQPILVGAAGRPAVTPTSSGYQQYQQMAPIRSKSPTGLIVTIAIGVIVLALVIWYIASNFFGGAEPGEEETWDPSSISTEQTCPTAAAVNQRQDHPVDTWVYGGDLAYPKLDAPWSAVDYSDNRIPFGRDTAEQMITIHEGYDGGLSSWVVSVMVGQLYAGDGFFTPEDASEIVNRCIFGTFYGENTLVTPEVLRSEAYTLDGKEGWITETNLSFNIEGLPTTSELAIVIIVASSDISSSIFYASIPNDAMQYEPDVRQAIADLKVVPR
ncbi:MAG: DUF2510 domain-containing protein [Propionibacteriaceae bacterium]|nr:DUF2510 domain-containing protein [Propionibacteriaceae bacterium]